jgi:hypothetical protein
MPVVLQVSNQRARSLDIDLIELSWRVADAPGIDALDYTFQVMRSESQGGPFETIGAPFSDRYLFIDNNIQAGHRWRRYYYQLRVTHLRTGDNTLTEIFSQEAEPDLVAAEVRSRMQFLMQEHAGRTCWILPVRTFGQRCVCWNRTLNKQMRSGCRQCFDQGFTRGFHSPIEAWVQIDPSPKTETVNGLPTQQSNTTARMPYYPALKPGDLIVEAENRRWTVVNVSGTEKARAVLHQEVALHENEPRDIEFEIPLVLEGALRDIWVTPARNFTNPQTLEAFENESVPGIYGLYGRRY